MEAVHANLNGQKNPKNKKSRLYLYTYRGEVVGSDLAELRETRRGQPVLRSTVRPIERSVGRSVANRREGDRKKLSGAKLSEMAHI